MCLEPPLHHHNPLRGTLLSGAKACPQLLDLLLLHRLGVGDAACTGTHGPERGCPVAGLALTTPECPRASGEAKEVPLGMGGGARWRSQLPQARSHLPRTSGDRPAPPMHKAAEQAQKLPAQLERRRHIRKEHDLVSGILRPGGSRRGPQQAAPLHQPAAQHIQAGAGIAPAQPPGQQEYAGIAQECCSIPEPIRRGQPRSLLAFSLPKQENCKADNNSRVQTMRKPSSAPTQSDCADQVSKDQDAVTRGLGNADPGSWKIQLELPNSSFNVSGDPGSHCGSTGDSCVQGKGCNGVHDLQDLLRASLHRTSHGRACTVEERQQRISEVASGGCSHARSVLEEGMQLQAHNAWVLCLVCLPPQHGHCLRLSPEQLPPSPAREPAPIKASDKRLCG
mmetsp:Transcript_53354/g.155491  ORF Transcript_53354/g.155491 Transcript_53354/m.155491 type:complete len:394 (+) Transcript_53354:985-2166(+)